MESPYKVALIGLGKMGVKNASNSQVSSHYQYSSHIEALRDCPDFDCGALYDRDQSIAGQNFGSLDDIAKNYCPEVLVLATPPHGRLETIMAFTGLKAVVMEKPVAANYDDAKAIVAYCAHHNILLQINYWRRFDESIIDLKSDIENKKDSPQVIFMTYGNGLRNNAVHLIDQIRYLFGEISEVKALSPPQATSSLPVCGDVNIDFSLTLDNGGRVYAHALDFKHYREVGLDIWCKTRRIEFIQGGLVMRQSDLNAHRALEGDHEITSDAPILSYTAAGTALYRLYHNLTETLHGERSLFSDGQSALENERILDRILK
ncbi:MAG: Gfo/Idh/MocA family protein [Alphaproteobacteria bacterium]